MFPFCMALQMISYFLSTLAPNLKSANSISYGLVLFAIVVESFVANDSLMLFIFEDNASALIEFLKYFLTFYPPFGYTKVQLQQNIGVYNNNWLCG
jgi:ribosome biogenesis protein Tsr3